MDLSALRSKILQSQSQLLNTQSTASKLKTRPPDSLPASPSRPADSDESEMWDNKIPVDYAEVVNPAALGLSSAKRRLKAVLAASKFSRKILSPSPSPSPQLKAAKPKKAIIPPSSSSSSSSPSRGSSGSIESSRGRRRRSSKGQEVQKEKDRKSYLSQGRAVETLVKILGSRKFSSDRKREAFTRVRGRNFRISVSLMVHVLKAALGRLTAGMFRRRRGLVEKYERVEIVGNKFSVEVNTVAMTRMYKAIVVCRVMGNFVKRLGSEIERNFRCFFDRLRINRKRQIEIAFLRAAISELKKLEIK